jgi:hypothetical protein
MTGWLFADLLLALAMIFLVANSVAHVPAPPPTPTPTPAPTLTPSPTATPAPLNVLDLNYIEVSITQVDYAKLHQKDPGVIEAIESQIIANSRLKGRCAGLVLTFGGSAGNSNGVGTQAADDVDNIILPRLGKTDHTSYRTFTVAVSRPFFAPGQPVGQILLDVYVYKKADACAAR